MNCLNHPDVPAVAYCQNCGKPLCSACMRTVGGVVYCEPCLAARLSVPPGTVPANLTGLHAHPVLAGLLGFIPGVGAMYNGQFVKALAHVLIFAVFVSLSDKSTVFVQEPFLVAPLGVAVLDAQVRRARGEPLEAVRAPAQGWRRRNLGRRGNALHRNAVWSRRRLRPYESAS